MKIGLALSGGGIRCLAHAGVLKALEENGIKIDIIGGTSAGSMVSSLYAMGYTPDEILECFKENYNKIIGKSRFSLINGVKNLLDKKSMFNGFRKGENIEKIFDVLANNKRIYKLNEIKMPLVIPTVDILNSKEYIFTNYIPETKNIKANEGTTEIKDIPDIANKSRPVESENSKYITNISVGKAIRASSSFPAVFNLCTVGKHAFMDGGALNNVPAMEMCIRESSLICSVLSNICSILEGRSIMSAFSSSITWASTFSSTSAKYIAKIAISTTWEVYAFVEATAIAGPACVYIE